MAAQESGGLESSSFRDPASQVFYYGGRVYRRVNEAGKEHYDSLKRSGLYDELTAKGWLVKHEEVAPGAAGLPANDCYKVLRPETISLISYPYEWSFSQLKDAALLTLGIQKAALAKDMILKDASAYNVQFENGRPVLIDTLSFEPYGGERAWKAYRQFCQHFLAPLALMAKTDIRLNQLLREHIDGLPLDLAVNLLPAKTKLRPGIALHLVAHARSQRRHAASAVPRSTAQSENREFAKRSLLGLTESLERTVNSLRLPKVATEWGEYYSFTNYSDDAARHKAKAVKDFVKLAKPEMVWDLGGNDGRFTRVALDAGARLGVCWDIDPLAVEKNYNQIKKDKEGKLLPLLLDLTNPSPDLGWAHSERQSVAARAKDGSCIMALALIHHLAISNNLPFDNIARYFAELGEHLIIEFVPKEDSKVQTLLATREDIFGQYDQQHFEAAFERYYTVLQSRKLKDSARTLYLMRRK